MIPTTDLLPLTINKEVLAEFPIEMFDGTIVVISSHDEVSKAVMDLRKTGIIGFDTETKPSFHRGMSHKVALIQLSTLTTCYLFRLNELKEMPIELLLLLQDPKILKIGLSLRDDFMMMRRFSPIEPKGFVDLQHFVKDYNIGEMSLQKIYALIFEKKISKSQRLSNWEQPLLTEQQQMYAAIDAWACLRIYNYLINRNEK